LKKKFNLGNINQLIEKRPYCSILVILLLALFQVIFFTKALKFDNASQVFIFSNYISQCIQNDIFPYWNPYIHLGSPFYGDLVSRYHYPPIWLFSYTTGYSFFSLHIEFFLVYLGTAIGAYKFFSLFHKAILLNITFSIVLGLSGFMLGHAQHLWIITSFCFFIWNLFFLYKVIIYDESRFAIPLGISLAFSLLGGYSPMCFIQLYLYLGLGFYLLFKTENYKSIAYLLGSGVIFTILCSGYFYSLALTFNKITRTDGVSLELANGNPFSPWSFVTLIHPGFIISDSGLFNTDLSMRSAYLGALFLPLFFYGCRYLPRKYFWTLISISILFFAFSLGHYSWFRTLLYHYVPLMNYFQYSALFRFVPELLLLSISITSAYHIVEHKAWVKFSNILYYYLPFYGLFFVSVLIYFALNTPSWHRLLEFSLIMTIFTAIALLATQYTLKRSVSDETKKIFLCLCILLDMIGTTQVLAPLLVYNRKLSVYRFQEIYAQYNRSFDYIATEELINYSSYSNRHIDSFLNNGNFLIKTPTIHGYDNYKLKKYYEWKSILDIDRHRFVYTSNKTSQVDLTRFSPNQMSANINSKVRDTCTLLQNYFTGWTATVNGQRRAFIPDSFFPKIVLEPGISRVEFNYDKPEIKQLHYLQMGALFLLSLLFIILELNKRRKSRAL
jgi:hypothetical protein